MLRYYRFHADLPHPVPARPVYVKGGSGSGWPEHCPPIRTANAYGWDILNPFRMHFVRDKQGNWDIEEAVEVHSDVEFPGGVTPQPQINAWFWEKGQQRPHVIDDHVYAAIRHQVKISTFLYLATEPDWMLLLRGIPGQPRPWSVIEAVVETDWYSPAHPWHGVIELPRIEDSPIDEVIIDQGQPLFRLLPIERAQFTAAEMSNDDFGELFDQAQHWLAEHGKDLHEAGGDVLITGAYARQQVRSEFLVLPEGHPPPAEDLAEGDGETST